MNQIKETVLSIETVADRMEKEVAALRSIASYLRYWIKEPTEETTNED